MSNLGRHRADHCETLRLELSMLQPLAFFHLRPQRGSSVLHCLLQMIVRTAKRRQQPDNDEKEHKKHDAVPDGNQRMLIRRPTEYVAEEPHARTKRCHCESGRAPGHPSRKACWQQVKSRYCPLTTRKIIHKAENNCQHHSCGSRDHLRSHTKLSLRFTWNSVLETLTRRFGISFMVWFISAVSNTVTAPQDRHFRQRPA